MSTAGQAKGRIAEDHALSFLQNRGLRLIERNYRCRYGEIDLVMEDGRIIVFVEVRYRASLQFGGALESVDRRKQAKLLASAVHFLREKRMDRPARFDVAALATANGELTVKWVKDAFQAA
ncbi:YraN family protein [Methylocaldum sp. MU1018]